MLDIDYTLFDHRSTAENPLELMRPCKLTIVALVLTTFVSFVFGVVTMFLLLFCVDLHEFLTAVYAEYDIMIWSATRSDFHLSFSFHCFASAFRGKNKNESVWHD